MYIIGAAHFAIFIIALVLSQIMPEHTDALSMIMILLLLSGVCWISIPTSQKPYPKVTFIKDDFKRIFGRLKMLPVYGKLLCVGAVLFSALSITSIVFFVLELI